MHRVGGCDSKYAASWSEPDERNDLFYVVTCPKRPRRPRVTAHRMGNQRALLAQCKSTTVDRFNYRFLVRFGWVDFFPATPAAPAATQSFGGGHQTELVHTTSHTRAQVSSAWASPPSPLPAVGRRRLFDLTVSERQVQTNLLGEDKSNNCISNIT